MNVYSGNKAVKTEQIAYLEGETDPEYAKIWLAHNGHGPGMFTAGWSDKTSKMPRRKLIQIQGFEIPQLQAKKLKARDRAAPGTVTPEAHGQVREPVVIQMPEAPKDSTGNVEYMRMCFELMMQMQSQLMSVLTEKIDALANPFGPYAGDDDDDEDSNPLAGFQKMMAGLGPLMQGMNMGQPQAQTPAAAQGPPWTGPAVAPPMAPPAEAPPPAWAEKLLKLADQLGLEDAKD